MANQRKFEECVFPIPQWEGELPEAGGAPTCFPMMMLNWWAHEATTNTLELFKVFRPGVAVGTLDEFQPEPGCGVRYYDSMRAFKSYPYRPTMDSLYCFVGLDPDRPDYLGATIEAWIGEGEEAEQYIITKPGAWLTPANVLHGPFVVREVDPDAPFLFFVCLNAPIMSMSPVKKLPAGFNFGEIEEQPIDKKKKYKEYFCDIDPRAITIPPSHKGKVTPIMFYDYYNNNEINRTIDCRIIQGSGIGFGIGEPSGDSMYEFAAWPHKHPFFETYAFLPLDENPADLGGTIEFWIGEGAEAEKYIISKPTIIMLPKGTVHFPMYVEEVHKPFLMVTVTDMPIWGCKWIEKLPPDFKHAIS